MMIIATSGNKSKGSKNVDDNDNNDWKEYCDVDVNDEFNQL